MGPLRRRVGWLFWRLLLLAPLVVWAGAGGPMLAPVMWAVLGYLLWRAIPGVREDLDRLRSWAVWRRRGYRRERGAGTL